MSAQFKEHVEKLGASISGLMDEILKIPTDGDNDRAVELGFVIDTLNDALTSIQSILVHEHVRTFRSGS